MYRLWCPSADRPPQPVIFGFMEIVGSTPIEVVITLDQRPARPRPSRATAIGMAMILARRVAVRVAVKSAEKRRTPPISEGF
jgi:hypothetical protein